MEETLSISGTVETVVYANEQTGYAVLEVADERDGELYTAVGPLCEVRAGEEVTLHGRFAMHPTFGQQFKTESYEVRLPETAAAIRRYLSGGALPHIGKAIAARIVAAFGEESLEVIASQPEVLATVKGLTREKAYEASREFQKMFGVREAIECLARWQLPARVAVALYRHYGPWTCCATTRTFCAATPLIRIFARQTPLPGSWAWNTIRSSACARALCMCCAII